MVKILSHSKHNKCYQKLVHTYQVNDFLQVSLDEVHLQKRVSIFGYQISSFYFTYVSQFYSALAELYLAPTKQY